MLIVILAVHSSALVDNSPQAMINAGTSQTRSLIIAPDGRIVAQSELKQEQLLTAEIDLALATRAMYRFDRDDCGPIIFGTEVTPAEYANAGPMGGTS